MSSKSSLEFLISEFFQFLNLFFQIVLFNVVSYFCFFDIFPCLSEECVSFLLLCSVFNDLPCLFCFLQVAGFQFVCCDFCLRMCGFPHVCLVILGFLLMFTSGGLKS